ncbi:MAG: molecular chaperone TorD family protein [Betaproteobacteria bacterium]|nr:MAG: molecular chaperone TorD family protein [Betaproteobacteria bacterium]
MDESAEKNMPCAMDSDLDAAQVQRVRNAVADDLRVLAALHDRELGPELLAYLHESDFPAAVMLADFSRQVRDSAAILAESLASIGATPEAWVLDELAADYAAIYLNHKYRASPCESVWLDAEGLALQAATFQIRSWYRRFGLAVENWRTRSDDHLVAQLHFLETLLRRFDEVDLGEIGRFMDEHLLRWLPNFAARVAERCTTGFYAGAALLTASCCVALRDLIVEINGEPRPSAEEIEQRMKPNRETNVVPIAFHPGLKPSW